MINRVKRSAVVTKCAARRDTKPMHYRWNAGEGGLVRVLTFILSPSIHPRCPRATRGPPRAPAGPRERREESVRDDCAGAKGISRPTKRGSALLHLSWMAIRGDNRVRAFRIPFLPPPPLSPSSCPSPLHSVRCSSCVTLVPLPLSRARAFFAVVASVC